MATLHARSTCCGARIHRFGGRRRRCCSCGRTWSVRRRKRGPAAARTATRLAKLVLLEKAPVRLLARRYLRSPAGVRRRLRQTCGRMAAEPLEPTLPDGDLVLTPCISVCAKPSPATRPLFNRNCEHIPSFLSRREPAQERPRKSVCKPLCESPRKPFPGRFPRRFAWSHQHLVLMLHSVLNISLSKLMQIT